MRKRISGILAASLCCFALALPVCAQEDSFVVQQVQQRLNEEGFDCGTPDGIAGAKTEEAIRAFQESMGLSVDGEISEELLTVLGIGGSGSGSEDEESGSDEGEDPHTEQQDGEEEAYLDATGERYFVPGEDLLLFNLDGLKIILKGDQPEENSLYELALDVEVVNGYGIDLDICYGIDFEGNYFELPLIMNGGEEYYSIMDLCVVPAYSSAEATIQVVSERPVKSLEKLGEVKLYFTLYDTSRVDKIDLGPITVHFPGEAEEASGDTEEAPQTVPEKISLIEEADESMYAGNWTSIAPAGTFQRGLEIFVPDDWSFSVSEQEGFAVSQFLSVEKIMEMQTWMSEHPGEAYASVPDVSVLSPSGEEIAGALCEAAEASGAELISSADGMEVYELDEALLAENLLEGTQDPESVESGLASYLETLSAEASERILLILDEPAASCILLLADAGSQNAENALVSVRLSAADTEDGAQTETVERREQVDPEIPEDILEQFGGFPETVEGLRSDFDLDLMDSVWKQCDPEELLVEFLETGSCTLPVAGEGWSGSLSYSEKDGTTQEMNVKAENEGDQVTLICAESMDNIQNQLDITLDFSFGIDDVIMDITFFKLVDETGEITYRSVISTTNFLEKTESGSSRYELVEGGDRTEEGLYRIYLSVRGNNYQSWSGVYQDGKLGTIEYRSY